MEASLLAAARALSKPINEIYELGKEKFKLELEKSRANNNINKIYKSIYSVQKVKTIWQIDRAVSLKSFYFPSSLLIKNKKTSISSISKIPTEDNIVIQGMVGQGKSIFLRYLSYQELNSGTRLPIFFELRKIEKNDTLKLHIEKILDSYGFDTSTKIIDFLLSSGKLVLILDGFDEITKEKVKSITHELELLSIKYPELKIIVSSRPGSGIENSPYFQVFKLAPVSDDELPKILLKIADRDQAEEIVKAVKESSTDIKSLLSTPLMITLLVLVYKSEQKIPEQLSEFYENLFPLLFYRHDKSKPGYSRERATSLSERKLQQAFEAFCYITRKRDLTSISTEEMYSSVEEALATIQIPCESSSFIQDITKVSNLILEEGYKYYFIHKSVQEFHAASYVKSRPDEAAVKFYTSMIDNYFSWEQEIKFLSQIDTYRYIKYLFLPSTICFFSSLDIELSAWKPLPTETFNSVLKRLFFHIPKRGKVSMGDIHYGFGELGGTYRVFLTAAEIQNQLTMLGGNAFYSGEDEESLALISFARAHGQPDEKQGSKAYVKLSYYDYFSHLGILTKCYSAIEREIKNLHEQTLENIEFISREDRSLSI